MAGFEGVGPPRDEDEVSEAGLILHLGVGMKQICYLVVEERPKQYNILTCLHVIELAEMMIRGHLVLFLPKNDLFQDHTAFVTLLDVVGENSGVVAEGSMISIWEMVEEIDY